MTRHLVTGATGQDGRLLVDLLAADGAEVVACHRPGQPPTDDRHAPGVHWVAHDVTDTDGFGRLVDEHRPAVVHNLAALSSVGRSWDDPEGTRRVNATAVERMLDVLVSRAPATGFVQASSSEIFGPVPEGVADETTPLRPASPYAEAKADAHRAVAAARDAGLAATNLVLFGHTGPGHDQGFVIPTICRQAAEVAAGRRTALELRDPDISRDWGSARDFVRAFALAVDAPAGDYVIATGVLHRLGEVAAWALAAAGAVAEVGRAPGERPADFGGVRGDATRAAAVLGWRPTVNLRDEVVAMVAAARVA